MKGLQSTIILFLIIKSAASASSPITEDLREFDPNFKKRQESNLLAAQEEKARQQQVFDAGEEIQSDIANSYHMRGVNLPSMKGDTNQGNFLPGVFNYAYQDADFQHFKLSGINAIRIGVNVETANNASVMSILRAYVDKLPGFVGSEKSHVVVCMWDTLKPGEKDHGDGKVNNVQEMTAAWSKIFVAMKDTDVLFEIFNEPFGYEKDDYMQTMNSIIAGAQLPKDRVILDGLGYADDPLSLKDQWPGWLGFHVYPNWLPAGHETQENFSNLVKARLRGISQRVFITEFGADLTKPSYETYDPSGNDGDVNLLRGVQDALGELKARNEALQGTFVWHGWSAQDTYAFFNPGKNAAGKMKVENIEKAAVGAGVIENAVVLVL